MDRKPDFDKELDAHVQMHIEDNIRSGMSRDEARRSALLQLGGVEPTKERYRDQQRLRIVETTMRELRQAAGRLRRSPAFTIAAVLSLALAIAANVAIFAVVERVVIHPLPYWKSQQLVMLDFSMPARNIPAGFNSMTLRQYFHYTDHARSFDALSVYRPDDRTITGQGSPERIRVLRTTPSLASVLRVAPIVGTWLPDGPRAAFPAAAVLSNGFWNRRFGADRGIVGRSIVLNGVATTVVGVMPASFAFPDPRIDAWINEPLLAFTDDYSFTGIARVREGIAIANARAEITQLSRTLHASAPGNGYEMLLSTALPLQDFLIGPISTALWTLLASAAVVLLVACANIANLFLVRSEARQREIGVRRALGAGTGGIAAYFFAESALLSAAGAALGLLVASYAIRVLVALGPVNLPRLHEVALAPVHLLFTFALTVIAAVVFGTVPLARLGGTRVPLQDGARGATAGRRSHRTRQILMAGQVALALTLLVASGLLFRSFLRLRAVDPGFDATSTLTFEVGLPRREYAGPRIAATHHAILDRLSALPGVSSASVVNCVPLSGHGYCGGAPLFIEGEAATPGAIRPIVAARPIAASFFDAMGMHALRGRLITRADVNDSVPVTVISDSLARTAFGGADPIGRRIRLAPHQLNGAPLWFTVVGIVKTTPIWSVTEARPAPQMYTPLFPTQAVFPSVDVMTYVMRTSVSPESLVNAARNAVREVDSNLAIAQVRTLQDLLDAAAAPRTFTMVLIAIAATTALLLGVVGIYGVMSYIVSQRTNEIGVRLALGAEPARVMAMVIRQGGVVTIGGIAAGLIASLAGSRVIASLLYDVSPRDPQVFALTTLSLLAVALVACWIPARRAANVDPLIALRAE